ncbi:hypothetical protein ACGFZQ_39100 [Streptomyces sp. NPDC048254]|uniref:hypothetical protein n=1 Tax=Streptomyces sp. NPDC048254 TaxID=3365525 RepID=UPI003710C80B
MARTVARVIVDALSELGVRQVSASWDALNALTDDVERVGCRHEEAAAFTRPACRPPPC